ncbi:MAG: hypothetical protein ABI560_14365 [Myxococcales bacterium]
MEIERNHQGDRRSEQAALTNDDLVPSRGGPSIADAAKPSGRRATFIVWFSVCLALVLLVAFNMR